MCILVFFKVIIVSCFNQSLRKLYENCATPCPSRTGGHYSVLLEGDLTRAYRGKKTDGVFRVDIWESGRYLILKSVTKRNKKSD